MKALYGISTTDGKKSDEGSSFGSLIKKYRKDKGFTLKDLEKMANVDHTYINRIENGTRKEISFAKVIRLAVCLGIPYNVLISKAFSEINLDGIEEDLAFQDNPWFQRYSIVNSLRVNENDKGALVRIVEFILDCKWNSKTKVHELYQLSEMIDDLKEEKL